jgi:competence protein ComEC
VSASAALLFNASNWLALSGLIKAVEMFASAPCAYVPMARPGLLGVCCYYGLLALFVNLRRVYWARRWLLIAGLCSANLGIWISTLDQGKRMLQVTFLDVGSGDAIFIRSPRGKTILIDGGKKSPYEDCGERVLVPFLRSSGFHRIDTMVLSHPHADHLGGFLAVMREFDVGQVLESGIRAPSSLYREYETALETRGIPRRVIRAGESLSGFEPLSIRFLHPVTGFVTAEGQTPYGINNGSVVMRLEYGRVSFLFMGDAESRVEESLLTQEQPLEADVIKISHQGSRTGTSERWLGAVRPSLAVISVGRGNPFHHPDQEVIDRLEHRGIDMRRTDRHGAVMIKTDGKTIRVRTMVHGHDQEDVEENP